MYFALSLLPNVETVKISAVRIQGNPWFAYGIEFGRFLDDAIMLIPQIFSLAIQIVHAVL